MQVGDAIYCIEYYCGGDSGDFVLECIKGEKYYINSIDTEDDTYEILEYGNEDSEETWIYFTLDKQHIHGYAFGFVTDYFESKQGRAKRIIKEYEEASSNK